MYNKNLLILTNRLKIRYLTSADVSSDYVDWFDQPIIRKYIYFSTSNPNMQSLIEYVNAKKSQDNAILFGIFDKSNNIHIGNIKYEPVSVSDGNCCLGIMIGNLNYRAKGIAKEAIIACNSWIKRELKIHNIYLIVHKDNLQAIYSYAKIGFKMITNSPYENKDCDMIWMLLEL